MSTSGTDTTVGSALSGKGRRALLDLFWAHPDQSFYLRQIVRSASDVDLVVVGEASVGEVVSALAVAREQLARALPA